MVGYYETLKKLWERFRELYAGSRERAEEFYAEEVFPLLVEKISGDLARELRARLVEPSRVKVAVCSVGLSWPAPAVFIESVSRVCGARVLAVCSKESLDVLRSKVLPRLSAGARVEEVVVRDPESPAEVLSSIWERLELARGDVVLIDITGGRKPTAASLYGLVYVLRLSARAKAYVVYLSGVPDRETKYVVPYTQELKVLEDPVALFGDTLARQALADAAAGRYSLAGEIFGLLAGSARRATEHNAFSLLSGLCEVEEALSRHAYGEAYGKLRRLTDRLAVTPDVAGLLQGLGVDPARLTSLLQGLQELREAERLLGGASVVEWVRGHPRAAAVLLADFFYSGCLSERRGLYELATLYYYRSIELALQLVLAYQYGIDSSNPKLSAEQVEAYCREREAAFSEPAEKCRPPEKFALMDDYLLLRALGSEVAEFASAREIRDGTEVRNTMILEHGFRRLRPGDKGLQKLKRLAKKACDAACRVLAGESLDDLLELVKRPLAEASQ